MSILWIAIPLFIQTILIFAIGYAAARVLKFKYEDAAPAAMIGASNHFEVAIATAVMLFGLSTPKDVVGKHGLTFVHPDDRTLLADITKKVMQGEKIPPFEWRLHTVDGNTVWVMGSLAKISFDGRPAVLGNYIDITHFKETRQELKSAYRKIEDLTIDLDSVREEERAQIAWELQENLGTTLDVLRSEISDIFHRHLPEDSNKALLVQRVDAVRDTISRAFQHLDPVAREQKGNSSKGRVPGANGIRMLLGSGQPILMDSVHQMLSGMEDLFIEEKAGTILDLMEKVKRSDVDMALVDSAILGILAMDKLKEIRETSPDLPILVYHTTGDDDDFAVRALRQGCAGYLSRSSSTNELISAIHRVAAGRKHISNRIAEKLAFEVDVTRPKPFHHKLSDRERQIMFLIAEGKSMKAIAEELYLSYTTIVTYRNRVLEKMNMKSNTEIVRYVVAKGLI